MQSITIRKINLAELPLIWNFAPPEWNLNLEQVYKHHFNQNGFHPAVALNNNEIAGTGIAMLYDGISWLGTIIVAERYRKQGIGNLITHHLIDFSKTHGAKSIILVASEIGLPIYKKIGFHQDINYLFFKSDKIPSLNYDKSNISPISKGDYEEIFHLDKYITNENRREILLDCMDSGFKYSEEKLTGYYLPDFGKGLIISATETAGLELLKFKIMLEKTVVCLPETNTIGIQYLQSIGYYKFLESPRMYLGEKPEWKSECIYARGCGYMG